MVLAAALAASLVSAASADRPVYLSRFAASYATQETVNRRFHEAYFYRAGGYVNCKRKESFNVRQCKIGWVIGDAGYVGQTRVALYQRANRSRIAVVRYRIRGIDEYCVYVRHVPISQCDHHYHGTARVGL